MNHITEDNLLAYALETDNGDDHRDIENHLQSCPQCRKRLAKVRSDIDKIAGIGTPPLDKPAVIPPGRQSDLRPLLRAAAVLVIGMAIGYSAALWTQSEPVTVRPQYMSPAAAHDSIAQYAISDVTGLAQRHYQSNSAR